MCKKKGLANKQIPSFCTHRLQDVWQISCKPQRSIRLTNILCIHVYTTPIHTSTHLYTYMHTFTHAHTCACAHTQQKQQQQPQPSPSVSLVQSWENTLGGALWQMFQEQGSTLLQPSLHALSGTPPQEWLGFCCVLSYASAHNPRDTIFKTDIYAPSWSLLWPSQNAKSQYQSP